MVTTIIEYYISTNFMHQSCLFELLGQLYKKKSMYLSRFEIKKTFKKDDKICPSEFLTLEGIEDYLKPHKRIIFIIIVESGNIKVHVEDQVYVLKSEKYLLYFLIKSTFVKYEY
jgi:AraC family transcriptional activator of pobA